MENEIIEALSEFTESIKKFGALSTQDVAKHESRTEEMPVQLPEYAERMTVEKGVLDAKIAALKRFLGSAGFYKVSIEEQSRLLHQHEVMTKYSEILQERIEFSRKD